MFFDLKQLQIDPILLFEYLLKIINYIESYYDFICQMKGYNRFKDYNIRSNENYHYLVTVPRVINGEYQYYYYENLNADLSQQFEKVKWDTWSICSIEELVNTDEEEEDVEMD